MTQPKAKHLTLWAIALPILLKAVLVAAVPLQAAIATSFGKTVVLRTVPIDPYDPFRGYYTSLRYDISQRGILSTLEGWNQIKADLEPPASTEILEPGRPFYVLLQAPTANSSEPPTPWQPIAVVAERPSDLPDNQIALRGLYRRELIVYGLERYYLPESERIELEDQIRAAQTAEEQPRLMVEVRIGPWGNAVPIALWLQDQRVEF
ncbi:MAG: GDYXXLXY domain-containing protein [Cyanobacteria bacterium J06638_28]